MYDIFLPCTFVFTIVSANMQGFSGDMSSNVGRGVERVLIG